MFSDEISIGGELAKVVFGALTGEEELHYASLNLLEKYGIERDERPTLVEIAREAQSISIALLDNSISDELRDQRVKSLLKKVVIVASVESEDVKTDPIADRISSLGE
jgi:hypothetical protein